MNAKFLKGDKVIIKALGNKKGVKGFRIEGEIVCPDCIEEEEIEEMTKSNLLTE